MLLLFSFPRPLGRGLKKSYKMALAINASNQRINSGVKTEVLIKKQVVIMQTKV